MLIFTLGVALATGIGFGLVPALSSSGGATAALREGGSRATARAGTSYFRNGLVVVELALSFTLLVGAGLMIRSFWNLQRTDLGFEFDDVLTMRLGLNWSHYSSPEERLGFFQPLLEDVETLPGVLSAAYGDVLPLNEASVFFFKSFLIEGQSVPEDQGEPSADTFAVSKDYFETIGARLLRGRFFTENDDADAPKVVLLNESMAGRYWPDQNPLGKRISNDGGTTWMTVVGVVADMKSRGSMRDVVDELYLHYLQHPPLQLHLMARTEAEPMALVRPVHEAVYRLDPEQPVSHVQSLSELYRTTMAAPRLTTILLGLFAALALVIAATGLGGVTAFTVNQQSREIGIRMALGAGRADVLQMVLRKAFFLTGSGLLLGVMSALLLSRLISSLLFGLAANDVLTFLGMGLVIASVTATASFLPARRASRVDPVAILRLE